MFCKLIQPASPAIDLISVSQINFEIGYGNKFSVKTHDVHFHSSLISFIFRLIQPMTPQSTVASKPSLPPLPSIDVRHFAMNEAVIALRTKIGLLAKSIT